MTKYFIAGMLFIFFEYLYELKYDTFESRVDSIKVNFQVLRYLKYKLIYAQCHVSVYLLLFVMIFLMLIGFIVIYDWTHLMASSVLMGLMFGLIPLMILDIIAQYINKQLTLEVSKWISILTRWATVKEDIYYCFEKSQDQIQGPLKQYVSQFLLQSKYTGQMNDAFEQFIDSTQHVMLRNLVINLQQAAQCQGDLVGLLERLEEESYEIFGESEKRSSETYFDKLAVCFSILCVFLMTIVVFLIHEPMRNYYLLTSFGQVMLTVFSLLFCLGVYIATKISAFNY